MIRQRFEERLDRWVTTALVDCRHEIDGQQVPCPPMCPVQMWPHTLFRRTLLRRRWRLNHTA